jgi:hypothetical protein
MSYVVILMSFQTIYSINYDFRDRLLKQACASNHANDWSIFTLAKNKGLLTMILPISTTS